MRGRRLSALAVGTLAAFGAVPGLAEAATPTASGATEPATELILEGDPNDQMTGGYTGVVTPPVTSFSVGRNNSSDVYFMMGGVPEGSARINVILGFEPPPGGALTPGTTYTTTGSRYCDPTQACQYMDWGGMANSPATGSFKVDQFTVSGAVVTQAEIEFSMSQQGHPALRGLIRYNATGALPLGAPTGKPQGPTGPIGTVEPLTARRGTSVLAVPAGATDGPVIATSAGADSTSPNPERLSFRMAWSPLGQRIYFPSATGDVIDSARLDGTDVRPITQRPDGVMNDVDQLAVSPDGSTLAVHGVYSTYGITIVPTDGSNPVGTRISGTGANPAFAPNGALVFTDYPSTTPNIYRWTTGGPALLIANADEASFSPDGSMIAFVRHDAAGQPQVFTVGADGSTGLTQVTQEKGGATKPVWSPDGKYLAYVRQVPGTSGPTGGTPATTDVIEIPVGGGAQVGSVPNADSPVWTPPVVDSHVTREWGADRVATAVAASQINFADAGNTADPRRSPASAVVLSRSDQYADALGGSSLAVRRNAPLLITPSGMLDPAVRTEIRRVLKPGGTVYLLGGTAALSPSVASSLAGMGYTVSRLAGPDRYATAVAIAKAVDPKPNTLLVATGANFPDALAAGATGEPLVLTDGASMPAPTASYLNTLTPAGPMAGRTVIVTVGGPGDTALRSSYQAGKMPSWPSQINVIKLAGSSRYDTALLVAQTFFASDTDAALATGMSWPDALSGGAMVGHRGGPLLLTDPTGATPAVLDYLKQESGSLYAVHLLGGRAALPDAIANQAAAVIGVPGHVRIDSLSPGGAIPLHATTGTARAQAPDDTPANPPSKSATPPAIVPGTTSSRTTTIRR